MDEQHNGFDQSADLVGPETNPSSSENDPSNDQESAPRSTAGREMLTQLQQMIDTISYQAGPVVRDIGAKAAELAAVAGAKAGPLAHKAADATDQFGQRVATRSKSIAEDLRRKNEPAARGRAHPMSLSSPSHPTRPTRTRTQASSQILQYTQQAGARLTTGAGLSFGQLTLTYSCAYGQLAYGAQRNAFPTFVPAMCWDKPKNVGMIHTCCAASVFSFCHFKA